MTVIFTVKKLGFAWVSRWLANGNTLQILTDSSTIGALAEAYADDSAALQMIKEVGGNDPLYAEVRRQVSAGIHDGGAA